MKQFDFDGNESKLRAEIIDAVCEIIGEDKFDTLAEFDFGIHRIIQHAVYICFENNLQTPAANRLREFVKDGK